MGPKTVRQGRSDRSGVWESNELYIDQLIGNCVYWPADAVDKPQVRLVSFSLEHTGVSHIYGTDSSKSQGGTNDPPIGRSPAVITPRIDRRRLLEVTRNGPLWTR